MGIREKLLILLMASVIGYGAYDFTMTKIRKGSLQNRVQEVKEENTKLISTTRTNMDSAALSPREQELLEGLAEPWQSNIYVQQLYPPPQVTEIAEPDIAAGETANGSPLPDVEPAPVYRYTGFMNIANTILAVINGREYQVGDPIGTSNYVVQSIDEDEVNLARQGSDQPMTLPIQRPKSITLNEK